MRIILAGFATLLTSSALASPEEAKQGRYALSAWQCFTYASNAGRKDEMERLFNIGFDTVKKFLEAARANKISREDANSNTPMIVLLSSQGPTVDFAAGRIFEAVSADTYDKMAKSGEDGVPLPTEKWITDEGLLKSISETKYQQSNCDLIK
ncbi:hypothetical protein Rleg10DRAFT_5607 [Rhizobium leguminosarum bv. trifolii WSM2012]|nr:hypothetical protein Rleg10DRAFT_4378 [Rhizobium leguminosarum bv. trifolii WSM2012]EJC76917.1 hypothetical protein Rleg10DRAFT_5607 [Rhizobium leguminosarum bv. trifolii WSM2012]